jgi:hypothetical protein
MGDSYPAKTWWEETRGVPSGYWTAFRPFSAIRGSYLHLGRPGEHRDGLKLADVAFRDNLIRHTTISGK